MQPDHTGQILGKSPRATLFYRVWVGCGGACICSCATVVTIPTGTACSRASLAATGCAAPPHVAFQCTTGGQAKVIHHFVVWAGSANTALPITTLAVRTRAIRQTTPATFQAGFTLSVTTISPAVSRAIRTAFVTSTRTITALRTTVAGTIDRILITVAGTVATIGTTVANTTDRALITVTGLIAATGATIIRTIHAALTGVAATVAAADSTIDRAIQWTLVTIAHAIAAANGAIHRTVQWTLVNIAHAVATFRFRHGTISDRRLQSDIVFRRSGIQIVLILLGRRT